MITDLERQDLRHAVLHVLAPRTPLYLSAGSIAQPIRRLLPFDFSLDDVRAALQFQVGLGNVEQTDDPFGSEKVYRITSNGTLAYERDTNKVT
ncbi:MAG: hypothetical protein HQ559_16240 [Lentisphaerae bacterium]|nr:hypothetical protein [Lentisphaerota bacterium]